MIYFSEEASDKDFLKLIPLLRPVDLHHLFYELGLRIQDIEKAEIDAPVPDVDMKALKVLQRWHQYKGREANRGALLEALKICSFTEAIDMLRQLWNLQGR